MLHNKGNYLHYFYVLGIFQNYESLVLASLLELVAISTYINQDNQGLNTLIVPVSRSAYIPLIAWLQWI